MSPLIGRTLAHYRITAAIGAGGMGESARYVFLGDTYETEILKVLSV